MKEVVCGIVFILYVDYIFFTNTYSWIKREKMSDHYFKFTPIDRLFLELHVAPCPSHLHGSPGLSYHLLIDLLSLCILGIQCGM